jgi:hypothetical protein
MAGWIKLHRDIETHWISEDADHFRAWIIILLEVNHAPKTVLIRGHEIDLMRGQSAKSLESWGKLFGGWERNRVRRFFKLLQKCDMVRTEDATKTTLLTVLNYCKYQDRDHVECDDNATKDATIMRQSCDEVATKSNPNKKENNKKKENKKEPSSEGLRLADSLVKSILSWKQDYKKPTTLESWAIDIDRMINLDSRSAERIADVIQWLSSDAFWQVNVMSGSKLRKQFDRLEAAMRRSGQNSAKNGAGRPVYEPQATTLPEKPLRYFNTAVAEDYHSPEFDMYRQGRIERDLKAAMEETDGQ